MKRSLILLLVLVATAGVYAQDVIYKTNGDSVVAKIDLITDRTISFHRWDNLQGPAYSLALSNIASIRYANGMTETLTLTRPAAPAETKAEAQTEPQAEAQTAAATASSGTFADALGGQTATQDRPLTYTMVVREDETTPAEKTQSRPLYIVRQGNTYFYGKTAMDKQAYIRFLQQNCPEAYHKAYSGYKTAIAGWALFSAGIALEIGGLAGTMVGAYSGSVGATTAFASLYYIGALSTLASIPTLAVGYAKMHNSVDIYAVQCTAAAKPRPTLGLQAGPNGIGLALNF